MTATIETLETRCYRIPLPVTLTDSTHGDMTHFELITVRIKDSDGAEGVGYSYTVNHGGRAVHCMVEHDLAPLLIGDDPARISAIWEKMWWATHYIGRGGIASFAISAIDIALWDLAAKRQNLPLWKILGGHNPKVKAYAGGIDLLFTMENLLAQTDANLAKGFKAIKMKVGRDNLAEDVERVKKMRDYLPDDVTLMADANMRWSRDEALKACKALSDTGLFWIEEPLIPDDEIGHAKLLEATNLPIATGENFHTIYEFERMIRAGGVSFPEPDVSNCGGITIWMKVATLAEAANLKVTSHGVHDLHVHLLAAVSNKSFLEVHGFGLERYIAEPLTFVDGYATAPDRPGHGVELDWDALNQF